MSEIVTLNVGGETFTTQMASLQKHKNSMLYAMLSGGFPIVKDSEGRIFLDRDPTHFRHILNYLRSGRMYIPKDLTERMELMEECDYYLLTQYKAQLSSSVSLEDELSPQDFALRAREDAVRQKFLNEPESMSCKEEWHASLINVYENRDEFLIDSTLAPNSKLMLTTGRVLEEDGTRSIAASYEEFIDQFNAFTVGLLKGMDWNNVFVAGGCVLGPLLPLPVHVQKEYAEQYYRGQTSFIPVERWRRFRHWLGQDNFFFESPTTSPDVCGFSGSDIDLFLYGMNSDEEYIEKIKEIFQVLQRNAGRSSVAVRTERTISVSAGWPCRVIQIILRKCISPAEILLGFDLDCVSVGFDGSHVWCLPRCQRALNGRFNIADPSRQTFRTNTYEYRLWKYSKRGFAVMVPGFDRTRLDTSLYLKPYKDLTGLARLLFLEARDFQKYITKGTNEAERKAWLEENRYFLENEDSEFRTFLEEEIVSKLMDYNNSTLLPFHPKMSTQKILEDLEARALALFNNNEKVSFVAGRGFDVMFDADKFEIDVYTRVISFKGQYTIPRHIQFIGSLRDYLTSLPDVHQNWYRDAFL